jgi:hypothetical protein
VLDDQRPSVGITADDALQEMAQLRTRELEVDVINAHLRRVQADFADEIVQHLRRLRRDSDRDDVEVLLRDRLSAQIISSAMFTALDIWLASGAGNFENLERPIDSALSITPRAFANPVRVTPILAGRREVV